MELSKAQREAVEYTDGPQIILAGAGSGKTRVIVAKAQYLTESKGYEVSSLLVITFSTKTQAELEDRFSSLGVSVPEVRTFHALGFDIIGEFGHLLGLQNVLEKASEYQLWQYLKEAMAEVEGSVLFDTHNAESLRHQLRDFIARAKDELVGPEEIISRAEEELRKLPADSEDDEVILERGRWSAVLEAGRIYRAYERIKSDNGDIDYGDMLSLAHRLLSAERTVAASLRSRFKYILVDEFQDTNYAQVQTLRLLAGEKRGITVVGDDDQAIYRFRGASSGAFKLFKRLFPKTKTFKLEENYRSTANIVRAAQLLIDAEPQARFEPNKKMAPVGEKGAKVLVRKCPDDQSEAESVAEEITKLLEMRQYNKPASIGVLFRSRRHKDCIAQALQRRGIEFYYDRCLLEMSSKPAQILRAIYEFTADDARTDLLIPIVHHFVPGLSPAVEREIWFRISRDTGHPLDTLKAIAPDLDEVSARQVQELTQLLGQLRVEKETTNPLQLLEKTMAKAGILLAVVSEGKVVDTDAAAEVSAILNKAAEFQTQAKFPTHASFLEYLAFTDSIQEESAGQATIEAPVVLQTIHGSKGLEYPVVFMIGLSNRKFPPGKQHSIVEFPPELYKDELPRGDFRIQEERRLFYVGMTRAKAQLYLYGVEKRGTRISRFVSELEGSPAFEQVAVVETVAPAAPTVGDVIASHQALQDGNPSLIVSTGGDLGRSLSQALYGVWKQRSLSATNKNDFENLKQEFRQDISRALAAVDARLDREKFEPRAAPAPYRAERISYTDIETFDTCPLMFYFQKVLRLPCPVSPAMLFGWAVHRVLQQAGRRLLQGKTLSLDKLVSDFDDCWRQVRLADPDQKERLRARGKMLLERFVKRQSELDGRPLELERHFSIDLGDVKLTGQIDRIDETPSGFAIIDYKTGKQNSRRLRTDLQLKIYSIACQRILGSYPTKVMYMFLGDDTVYETSHQPQELDEVTTHILEKVREINASEFIATPGFHCGGCGYASICPARQA